MAKIIRFPCHCGRSKDLCIVAQILRNRLHAVNQLQQRGQLSEKVEARARRAIAAGRNWTNPGCRPFREELP